MSDQDELEPLDPEKARQMYLNERRHEVSSATLQSHSYRLKQFVSWCEDKGIDNLNELSGRDIHRFRVKRRDEDDLATATMKGQLATLRIFLRFCASIDAVQAGLDEQIILPTTTAEDTRDEMLEIDQAEAVLDYLEKYHYATIQHTLIEVLWHTGLRVGAAIGLDVKNYSSEEQYLELTHQPQEETPLKNGENSERLVALNDRVCRVLDDWLEENHPGVVDEYDRTPLLASKWDRLSRNRARSICYEYTRPCVYQNSCPHDRDIDDCEATNRKKAYGCPSSISPHPIRRGSITYHLREDTPKQIASSRMDVSVEVLERHYDERSEREKLRQRRQYLPD